MQNQIWMRPLVAEFYIPEAAATSPSSTQASSGRSVRQMIDENTVLVIGRRSCCMCHVMNRLLLSLGVNPTVYEVTDRDEAELAAVDGLAGKFGDLRTELPVVFVGGRLMGGLDNLMAAHITGELVPILKKAGALWL